MLVGGDGLSGPADPFPPACLLYCCPPILDFCFVFVYLVLGIAVEASHVLSKHSMFELYSQARFTYFFFEHLLYDVYALFPHIIETSQSQVCPPYL